MDSRAVKFNPSPRKIDPRALYSFTDLAAFCELETAEAEAAEAFIRGLPAASGCGDLLANPGRIVLSWGWFAGAIREIRRRRSAAGGVE